MAKNSDREANIELIRILSMLGIIIMHYFNPKIGAFLNILMEQGNKLSIVITYFFISIFACAVNLFILVSGYFMCQSYRREAIKPIKLLMQVVVFQVTIYLLGFAIGLHDFSIYSFIRAVIPANWYVVLYIVLYWISPYINIVIETLDSLGFKNCIILMFVLFSIYPTLVDVAGEIIGREVNGLSSVGMYGSQWGYSIVNFVLLYFIGAYINKQIKVKESNLGGVYWACLQL